MLEEFHLAEQLGGLRAEAQERACEEFHRVEDAMGIEKSKLIDRMNFSGN